MATEGIVAPRPGITVGLDVSSVCVGYAVFGSLELRDFGKFLQVGKWHGEKLGNFQEWLETLFRKYRPEHVLVELPHGRGGAALSVLTQYVAIVFLVHYRVFGRELPQSHRLYPSQVKACLKVPATTNHDNNKSVMVQYINNKFNLKLQYSATRGKSDDDIADAIALVVAWLIRSGRDDGRYNPQPDRARKRSKKPARSR